MNNQRGHGGPDICRRPFSLVLISWLFYQPQERHSHAMLHKLKPPVPGRFIMGSGTFQSGPSFYALGDDESAPRVVGVPTASRKCGLRGQHE